MAIQGINFYKVENSRISGCRIESVYGHGIFLSIVSNIVVTNNTVVSSGFDGITLVIADYNTVAGNIVESSDSGIYISSSNYNTVTGSIVESNGSRGILLYNSDYNIITSNRCTGNQSYGVDIVNAGCDKNLVATNVLIGNVIGSLNNAGTGTISEHNITA
jgi:parallel beta-helix repeat protein